MILQYEPKSPNFIASAGQTLKSNKDNITTGREDNAVYFHQFKSGINIKSAKSD